MGDNGTMIHSSKQIKFTSGIFFLVIIFFLVSFHPFYSNIGGSYTIGKATAAENGKIGAGHSAWPHDNSDLKPDPVILFQRLANGFRYVLMKNGQPEGRVSMHLNVQVGSVHETDRQQGLAHFLEHMLFNGSENFKPGELIKYFQSIGMEFGPDANAHTGFYETVYDIFLPDGKEDSLRKGLLVMKDYAQGALLLESEVERERKVILAEKRSRDSASYRTFVSSIQFELPQTRISRRLPIGTEEVLTNAKRSDLKAYYDTWYRPETMILVAVGDFDVARVSSLIKEFFAGISARMPSPAAVEFGDIDHQGIETFHHYEEETGNTTVTIEVLSKEAMQPDTAERRRGALKKDLADQIVQNRLDALIGDKETPGTSAAVGSGIFLNQVKYALITAEGDPQEWRSLLAFLEQTLRKALEYGFTETELVRVKKDFLADLDQAVREKKTRESKVLARGIIRALNAGRIFMSPESERDLLAPFIQSLTLNDVNQAFRDSWAPDHRLIMVTGNANLAKDGPGPEGVIRQTYLTSLEKAVAAPREKGPVVFPYLPVPQEEGRIVKKTIIEDLGIIQIDYENGFRLNLKKTDYKANEILATLSFGRGRYEEPRDLSGLAELSTQVLNESGLGSLNRDEIEAALAGKQTQLSFAIDESRFMFIGKTVPQELQLLFQLIYAYIRDPGFKPEAYDLIMNQFKNRYEESAHTLEGVMMLSGKRFLAGGDSRFGLPSYDKFSMLSLEDVRKWIIDSLSQANFELSIAGDVDVDAAIVLASKYLGILPTGRGIRPSKQSRKPLFPRGESLVVQVETKIPNGLVVVAYPTDDIWDIHQTRRLAVLADIFTERMRVRIREKLGEAYSPFAYNQSSRIYEDYGVFNVVVEVDPAKAQFVIDEIKKIATDLVLNGVSGDEIQRSLEPTLNRIRDMRQRNGYWLRTVLSRSQEYPEQIDWSRSIVADYASVKPVEVQMLANTYLKNDQAAVIMAIPSPKK